ncbi:MAG TPA: hypothetical protein VJQ08_07215 [Candidatus Dormibacteraeota bacterium]|nr:hypothetical protein [Candidatus Dormibacteraeota bacterium]
MSARAELGTLEASGLIEIAALQPELEYLFRHALVQEAAYASLLKQDRRSLHRAAAETILALHPGRERELAGVIGMHFEQSGDAASAARYLLLAGDHAFERFANREAVAFYIRAFNLADESQFDVRLRAAVGSAKAGWTINEQGTDIGRLEAALSAEESADQRLVTEAYFWIAFLRRARGEVPETSSELRVALERGARLGEALNDPGAAALPRAFLGWLSAVSGNLRQGAQDMREALEAIEASGDHVSAAIVSDFLAIAYARLGEFTAAEELRERSSRLAGEGDEIARIDADLAASALHLERGELDAASKRALSCAARAEEIGAYACVIVSNVLLAAATLGLDDPNGAKAPLERGIDLSRVTKMPQLRTLTEALLGSVMVQLGDLPGGVANWDEALTRAQEMHDRYGEAQTLWARGRANQKLPNPDWAAVNSDLDHAIELFEDMEARPSLARALHDRAVALRALGRAHEADVAHRMSIDLAKELGLKDKTPV